MSTASTVPSAAERTDSAPLLEVRNLVVRFNKNGAPAVDDVSFSIGRGETLGLVGESGSGKTTIGRAILGLQPVTSGQILFEGRDITRLSASRRRALQGDLRAVFQDPFSSLNPRRPIGDAITEPMRVAGVARPERDRRVKEVLDAVGLAPGSEARFPRQFSGGQRQRIAIARALALDPDVLVADEAVSALDVSVQAQVLELLDEIQTRLGIALLFITHDLRVAAQICDDVAVMQHGRIVEQGPAAQILTHPQQAYTRQLLDAAPGRDWDFANFRPVAMASGTAI